MLIYSSITTLAAASFLALFGLLGKASPFKMLFHFVGVFSISIVRLFNIRHLIFELVSVESECSPVRHPHMQWHIIAFLGQFNSVMGKVHEFLGQAQPAVSSEHWEGSDVCFSLIALGLIVHLGEYVAADLSVFLGDVEQLWPREVVIEVVVEVVVFGEAPQVAALHFVQVWQSGSPQSRH